ncbi:16S rRNA (cytosine(1402)-N(4))-methyltransferase [Desulfobacter hydrogenophilus]|uniref:Ribosomal RNA small subunit methyltransferase H n=1 Tax=Desulfobacter hydrogenophilus TaxID=2291 RepID=A0A328FC51_9BACT|nr:16S rRNA (cytosine(1402)-N(4))-methyltransferase RsmH [Desulfobacter hydrogenophilus]NDY73590.1 16S rRNA (cytosine(1402)-N(4))-methyltransferase RsmH [Desulfobacter hydrogenophilus]QBH13683.1 16S rRNA (cytosine(1402)-N(4))-methyltransferase RsmH [Desulfobacter hydrogenophilus]RAM01869.1 16S rRNA (cytosine(1402)-N(4))-methyltransferase [Desulfobacter hydrogenophilus]
MVFEHTSVMPNQVHAYQNLKPGDICVDCTLGGCGHAMATLKAIGSDGLLIGIDQDMDAIANARNVLHPFQDNVRLYHNNFSDLPDILKDAGINGVNSILLDLGFSLNQLTQSKRGFSFKKDEPLDMRMDVRNSLTAHQVVNTYSEKQLIDIFFTYGEERFSRRMAKAIIEKRACTPIATSLELAGVLENAMPARAKAKQKIHPATRVFQALRIVVNRELERLETFIQAVPSMLVKGGRISIISFHSLEDRIVKQRLRAFENGCTCPRQFPQCICGFVKQMESVTRKPVTADSDEIKANPMARSAKLRVAQRI